MFNIDYFEPFKIDVDEANRVITIDLAYRYLTISFDGMVFHFVPQEQREIKIDSKNWNVLNGNDIMIFHKGKQYLRISLNELVSHSSLMEVLFLNLPQYVHLKPMNVVSITNGNMELANYEVMEVIHKLELQNLQREIDHSLDEGDKDKFLILTELAHDIKTQSEYSRKKPRN